MIISSIMGKGSSGSCIMADRLERGASVEHAEFLRTFALNSAIDLLPCEGEMCAWSTRSLEHVYGVRPLASTVAPAG